MPLVTNSMSGDDSWLNLEISWILKCHWQPFQKHLFIAKKVNLLYHINEMNIEQRPCNVDSFPPSAKHWWWSSWSRGHFTNAETTLAGGAKVRDAPLYQSCSFFNIIQNAFNPLPFENLVENICLFHALTNSAGFFEHGFDPPPPPPFNIVQKLQDW